MMYFDVYMKEIGHSCTVIDDDSIVKLEYRLHGELIAVAEVPDRDAADYASYWWSWSAGGFRIAKGKEAR